MFTIFIFFEWQDFSYTQNHTPTQSHTGSHTHTVVGFWEERSEVGIRVPEGYSAPAGPGGFLKFQRTVNKLKVTNPDPEFQNRSDPVFF